MAPKPMLLVSATGDWTRHTPMVEFAAVTAIYRLFGRGEQVSCAHIHSPHNYNLQSREAVYAFFHRFPLGEALAGFAPESEAASLRPEDLLIGKDAPPSSGSPPQLFELWKSEMRQLNSKLTINQLRDRLSAVVFVGGNGSETGFDPPMES